MSHRRVALGSGGADAATGHIAQRADELTTIKLSDRKMQEFINEFFPHHDENHDRQCLDYAGHRKADGRAFLEPSPGAAEHSGFPVCTR